MSLLAKLLLLVVVSGIGFLGLQVYKAKTHKEVIVKDALETLDIKSTVTSVIPGA